MQHVSNTITLTSEKDEFDIVSKWKKKILTEDEHFVSQCLGRNEIYKNQNIFGISYIYIHIYTNERLKKNLLMVSFFFCIRQQELFLFVTLTTCLLSSSEGVT